MDASVEYRLMRPGEEPRVIELVSRVFDQFVAPLFNDDGVTEFMKYADPSILAERTKGNHFVLVALSDKKIIGIIEIREHSHIALFFVTPEHQRKGVGRELLNKAVKECFAGKPDLTGITVNASPNAVSAYRTLGFMERDEEKTVNGIRFVEMSLEVKHPNKSRVPRSARSMLRNMDKINYREAIAQDIPRIIELWQEFIDFHKTKDPIFSRSKEGPENFGKFISENLQNDDSVVFVADRNGKVVAHILAAIQNYPPVFEIDRYGSVMDLAVTAEYRRIGIGSHLFEMVKKWFLKKGVTRIEIEVAVANEVSDTFWKKMGFNPYKKTCYLKL